MTMSQETAGSGHTATMEEIPPSIHEGEVLVPGTPPLTQAMVDKVASFFGWMLEARLTPEQLREFRQLLVESWEKQDQEGISGTLRAIQMQDGLAQLEKEEERTLLRVRVQTSALAELRKRPDDPANRWARSVYDTSHQPLATGNPPLTSQAAEAYVEMMAFMASEALGSEPFVPDRAYRDAFAQSLASHYERLSPARQQQISQMPLSWAALRLAWPTLPAMVQDTYREQWRKALGPIALARATSQEATVATEEAGNVETPTSAWGEHWKLLQIIWDEHRMNMNLMLW